MPEGPAGPGPGPGGSGRQVAPPARPAALPRLGHERRRRVGGRRGWVVLQRDASGSDLGLEVSGTGGSSWSCSSPVTLGGADGARAQLPRAGSGSGGWSAPSWARRGRHFLGSCSSCFVLSRGAGRMPRHAPRGCGSVAMTHRTSPVRSRFHPRQTGDWPNGCGGGLSRTDERDARSAECDWSRVPVPLTACSARFRGMVSDQRARHASKVSGANATGYVGGDGQRLVGG
jgi:hypothetical protein